MRRLASAVIVRAIYDLDSPDEEVRRSAQCFLGRGAWPWAEATGLDTIHEHIQRIADKKKEG